MVRLVCIYIMLLICICLMMQSTPTKTKNGTEHLFFLIFFKRQHYDYIYAVSENSSNNTWFLINLFFTLFLR